MSKKKKITRLTPHERDMKLLNRVGGYMYGERWQRDLARDLDLNERTVRAWVQGRSGISPEAWRGIGKLLAYKINSAGPVLAAMERRIESLPADQ